MDSEGLNPELVLGKVDTIIAPPPSDRPPNCASTVLLPDGEENNISQTSLDPCDRHHNDAGTTISFPCEGKKLVTQQVSSTTSSIVEQSLIRRENPTADDGMWQKVLPKDNPRFKKYFNMLQVGLPLAAVAQKLRSDGLASSVQVATLILQNKSVPFDSNQSCESSPSVSTVNSNDELADAIVQHEGTSSTTTGNSVEVPSNQATGDSVSEKEVKENELETLNESDESDPVVVLGESMMYGKYFRMQKVGLPVETIKMKMRQAGLDPDILNKKSTDKMTMSALAATRKQNKQTNKVKQQEPPKEGNVDQSEESAKGTTENREMIALKDHPVYGKYFKMLQVGLPLALVKSKMATQEADSGNVVDVNVLEKDPADLYPVQLPVKEKEIEEEMVALQDHPEYAKYLKMIKVGLPLGAAKAKMKEDGFDPDLLDKELTDLVPVDVKSTLRAKEKVIKSSPSPKGKRIRKKKLHWKTIDASRLGADSLWAEDDDDMDDIYLDTDEFNMLFVESDSGKNAVASSLDKSNKNSLSKKQKSIIDLKRGQNGGIALARLKLSFGEVRERILKMDDTAFTKEQFRSLQEFLPTDEEAVALRRFVGDPEQLGVAERYMLEIVNNLSSPDVANNCLECVLHKKHFKTVYADLNDSIARIENACDDVKMSPKLKKVLKTILKVGNQMNDGEDHRGFSLDSLLKLQSSKAFDKKTSVLQYVVRLIHRNDESCLLFPEDLLHLSDATRISVEHLLSEKDLIVTEQKKCLKLLETMRSHKEQQVEISTMEDFLEKASKSIDVLETKLENMRKKYESVLSYFGEETTMSSTEFFETLQKFVDSFIEERAIAEKLRKAEARKNASANKAGQSRQERATTLNHIVIDSSRLLRNHDNAQNFNPLGHEVSNIPNLNSPNKPLPKKAMRRNSTFL